MWWHLLQGLIIFAVVASNIHYRWTPNGYLPAMLCIGLAWLLTLCIDQFGSCRNTITSPLDRIAHVDDG